MVDSSFAKIFLSDDATLVSSAILTDPAVVTSQLPPDWNANAEHSDLAWQAKAHVMRLPTLCKEGLKSL